MKIVRLRREGVTSKGNHCLECETDAGVTVFWASEDNRDNIHLIKRTRVPFTATCHCIPSNVPQHEWWVPEKSHVEIERQRPRAQRSNEEDHGRLALHGTPEKDEFWLDDASDQWEGAPERLGIGEDDDGRWCAAPLRA